MDWELQNLVDTVTAIVVINLVCNFIHFSPGLFVFAYLVRVHVFHFGYDWTEF